MDDIKERIKKKKYQNWVKSTLGLEQTKKALEGYVEQKFRAYTDGKTKLQKGRLLTADEITHIQGTEYIRHSLAAAVEYTGSKWRWKSSKYSCIECKSAFEAILSLHLKGIGYKNICWENSANTTNISLEWAIAKVFMPMGNEKNKGPEETDPYAMFHLMLQCELFFNCVRPRHLEKSKEIRNNLFHSSDNIVTDDDQEEYFDTMIALLTDTSNDQEVPQATRDQITNDIDKMKKLKTSDVTITIFEKALRIKRTGINYDFEKSLCENDPEKLREVLKLVEQIGGDMQHLKRHLHDLKNIDKYKNEIDELRKQRDNVKAVVELIPSAVRSIQEQNRQFRADVNVMQTECRRRTNEIQTSILRNLANIPSTEKLTQLKNKVIVLSAEHKKLKEAVQCLENISKPCEVIKAKMGDWKRNLRREISQVESEGMIIVVIVTFVMSLLLRILLFLDYVWC